MTVALDFIGSTNIIVAQYIIFQCGTNEIQNCIITPTVIFLIEFGGY